MLLRCTLDASGAGDATAFEVEIAAGPLKRKGALRRAAHGGLNEFDVTGLFGVDRAAAEPPFVTVRHPGYLPASAHATVEGAGAGRVTYSVRLEPQFVELVLRGRLLAPEGETLEHPRLAMVFAEPALHPSAWPVEVCLPEPDGSFEMRLTERRLGTLHAWSEGAVSKAVPVEQPGGSTIDLGAIQLTRGSSVWGVAQRGGRPLGEGALVRAALLSDTPPPAFRIAGMQLEGGELAWLSRETTVSRDGAFRMDGLVAGATYSFVAVPLGLEPRYRGHSVAGTHVRAPSSDITLDWGLREFRLSVRHRGAPVPGASARLVPAGADSPEGEDGVVGGEWVVPIEATEIGELDLLLPDGAVTDFEVTAPGFMERRISIDAGPGTAASRTVELQRGAAGASLTIRVSDDPESRMEGTLVAMTTVDEGVGRTEYGPSPVQRGVARFEGLPAGLSGAFVRVIVPESIPFESLPYVDEALAHMTFLPLVAGEQRVEAFRVSAAGRIEVVLTGRRAGLAPPRFEIGVGEASGSPEFVHASGTGHALSPEFPGSGPCALQRSLPAGDFTVRLLEGPYEAEEKEVSVQEGETARLTFALRVRS